MKSNSSKCALFYENEGAKKQNFKYNSVKIHVEICELSFNLYRKDTITLYVRIVKANTMVAQTKADIIPFKPRLSVAALVTSKELLFKFRRWRDKLSPVFDVGWKSEWQRQRASCIQASEHATEAGPESSAKYQVQVEIDARIEFYKQIVHIHQAIEDVLVVFHVVEKAGCFERIQDKCQRIGDEKYDNQDDHHHRKTMLPELRTAHCGTQATSPENRVHNAAVDRRQREQRQTEHGEEIHPMDEDLYIEFIAAQQWNHTVVVVDSIFPETTEIVQHRRRGNHAENRHRPSSAAQASSRQRVTDRDVSFDTDRHHCPN
ncbi:hypothetical protein T07_10096 [Trichinella nelsoni]|uniref:Uncharacterized protein n=1 Tax=Trichinella nelsoni TaxID=6336 RepID=A0A0V0RIW3_9BILA|nr:hypothetical protein T07_10096 [Trichinella nelsoni]